MWQIFLFFYAQKILIELNMLLSYYNKIQDKPEAVKREYMNVFHLAHISWKYVNFSTLTGNFTFQYKSVVCNGLNM